MSRFLSPEWLDELSAAAASSHSLRAACSGVRLTIGHRVTGGPDGDVEYRIRLTDGRMEVLPGGAAAADVTVHQRYSTAVAISRGEVSPAEAFATGHVRLGGTLGLLAEHREALSRLDDVFAELRAGTAY